MPQTVQILAALWTQAPLIFFIYILKQTSTHVTGTRWSNCKPVGHIFCDPRNFKIKIWCDFDRASSLICGYKLPTRCNRGFYCRSYCLLNMFRAPLCPSSGAQEYYTVVAACGISCCGFQVAGFPASILQIGHITLNSATDQQLENHSTKYHRQQPLYNTLELLMMGIVVPGTCWASNKICNKNLCCI